MDQNSKDNVQRLEKSSSIHYIPFITIFSTLVLFSVTLHSSVEGCTKGSERDGGDGKRNNANVANTKGTNVSNDGKGIHLRERGE